jgi:hypothetical protein
MGRRSASAGRATGRASVEQGTTRAFHSRAPNSTTWLPLIVASYAALVLSSWPANFDFEYRDMAQVGTALYTDNACEANLEDRTYCMSVRSDPPCRLSRCSLCLRCRTSVPTAPHTHVCRESADDWEHRTSRSRRLSARFCRRRAQAASRARCHCGHT